MIKSLRSGFFVFVLIFAGLVFAGSSHIAHCAETQNITFEWQPNSESDLAGYRLYRSTASGKYLFGKNNALLEIPAGTQKATIKTIEPGYFVLTAFDKDGFESEPSNELETFSPIKPNNFSITIVIKVEA